MMRPIRIALVGIAITAGLVAAVPAMAQQATARGPITLLRTGWNLDSFAVVTSAPVINPARCPSPDGYVSEKSLPGYQTYYSAALTALAARRQITVTVHNTECAIGRPKLIGIDISASD